MLLRQRLEVTLRMRDQAATADLITRLQAEHGPGRLVTVVRPGGAFTARVAGWQRGYRRPGFRGELAGGCVQGAIVESWVPLWNLVGFLVLFVFVLVNLLLADPSALPVLLVLLAVSGGGALLCAVLRVPRFRADSEDLLDRLTQVSGH